MPSSRIPGLALALVLGSASASFVVTEGDGVVTGDGVSSPGYPADYDAYLECTIFPESAGWLDVVGWELEESWWGSYCDDHLTVNGVQYCGEGVHAGPQGVAVNPATEMTFVADYYNGGHGGFDICLSSTFTSTLPPPTATPTIGPCDETATHFSVTEGNCTACGNCFYSPNHVTGDHYHDTWHDCLIEPLQSGYLDVQAFSIEESSWYGCM